MANMAQDRKLTAPVEYPEHAALWQAAREGRLLVRRCNACKSAHWYPRPVCPLCGSNDTDWLESTGRGAIYSVTVTQRGVPVPYAIAYVTLDEGPTLLTNIVDCDLDALAIGQRVKLVFKPTEGGAPVPMFAPETK